MIRRQISIAAFFVAVAALTLTSTDAQRRSRSLPQTWDNLVQVNVPRLAGVWVLPGTDFRSFPKVMIDPVEVSFRENWQRDFNNTTRGLNSRVRNADVQRIIETSQTSFNDVFADAYRRAGFQVVTAPGDGVMRVKTAVINLEVNAPDMMRAGRSGVYSRRAGEATLVLEAHDTTTGAIIGRVVDRRAAGDTSRLFPRNRATNNNDFRQLFRQWADSSANALRTLQSTSPVNVAAR
jgi:hypothetical protein